MKMVADRHRLADQKVTVIGCEDETSAVRPKSAVKPNKSPATWNW